MQTKINEIKILHDQDLNIDYLFRVHLLKKLKNNIIKYEPEILEALKKDLNKSDKEAFLTEINVVLWEIDYHLKNLKKWMKPHKVSSSIETFGMNSYLWYKPKGKVLIISPFNYPFNLTLMPLIGAISAGNKVLVKMASDAQKTKAIVYKIINETFDKSYVYCLNREDLITYDDIYDYEPNMIFFTGSTNVGKQIELECVKRNIEYITEMGGQNPCVVYDYNSEIIFDRIVWAKFLNAGQTCVTINYLLYNQNLTDFKQKLIETIKLHFPDPLNNQNINKIINQKEFNRLINILREQKANIIYGGKYDDNKLLIEPTIIEVKGPKELNKYGEIFGPILFIYPVEENINNTIKLINSIDNSPLAAYLYSHSKQNINKFLTYINAGGYTINDSISHILNNKLPFGGVYNSGFGSYHGKYSFEAFSFRKPIVVNNKKKDISLKYYNTNKLSYNDLKKQLFKVKRILFYK